MSEDPIDSARIEELRALVREGQPDAFLMLARIFLKDANERLVELRDSIEQGNAQSVATHAHALRGSVANLGAVKLAEHCAELERLGSSRNLEDAEAGLRRLESEFQRVQAFLQEQLRA